MSVIPTCHFSYEFWYSFIAMQVKHFQKYMISILCSDQSFPHPLSPSTFQLTLDADAVRVFNTSALLYTFGKLATVCHSYDARV